MTAPGLRQEEQEPFLYYAPPAPPTSAGNIPETAARVLLAARRPRSDRQSTEGSLAPARP